MKSSHTLVIIHTPETKYGELGTMSKNLKISYLEVKAQTLAAEARIIRRKEINAKKWKKRIEMGTKGPTNIKVKNRRENNELLLSLKEHRIKIVRPEARAAYIALGYIRGVPYRAIEKFAFTPPNWQKVWKNICNFALDRADPDKFLEWLDVPGETDANRNNYKIDYSLSLGYSLEHRVPSYSAKMSNALNQKTVTS